MSATPITFRGEPGWRFAIVEDCTIIERATGAGVTYDVFQQIDGDEIRIAKGQTLDAAIRTARQ